MIIQILFDHLQDKSKVLTSKGITKVGQTTNGIEVTTESGETLYGDILVGVDGIHSTVRREMWRLADQDSPGYFSVRDRANVPTEYCCIFGISHPTDKFPKYFGQNVQGRNYSYLVSTGPNHRIYWFLFAKLPETAHGLYERIPRYSEEQRDALAAEHAEDRITDTLTFGELYATRTTATLQALPEVVFKKWYYNRIITIGDAAHKVTHAKALNHSKLTKQKFNAMGTQGGNSAIEDAAVLANQLQKLLDGDNKTTNFTDAAVAQAFEETQRLRFDRATKFLKSSHQLQSVQAQDTLISRFIAKVVLPLSSSDSAIEMLCSGARGAAKIEALPVPNRPHSQLWDDEKPSKPMVTSCVGYAASVVVAVLACLAARKMQFPILSLSQRFLSIASKI